MKQTIRKSLATITLVVIAIACVRAQNLVVLSGTTMRVLTGTTLTVNGNITIQSGGSIENAGTIAITGNWINNGNGLINSAGGLVLFNGTVIQTIGGSNATTFHNITVTNPSGINLTAPIAAVSGTINIGASIIQTNSNFVDMLAGSSLLRTTGWIHGDLRKHVATGTNTRVFEVGNATSYTPASLTFNGATVAGTFRVGVDAGAHPSAASGCFSPSSFVNQYWSFLHSGVSPLNYSATLNYTSAEINGTPNYSLVKGGVFSGVWTFPAVGGTPTSVQTVLNGLSSSGDVFIGQGNVEVCGNGIDDDCDGVTDEGCGVVCNGTPSPGSTTTTLTVVCPDIPFTLGLSNVVPGSGLSYVYQRGPSAAGPWTTIGTGSVPTFAVATQTATRWYRMRVNCAASGQTGISTPVQVVQSSACGPEFSSPTSNLNTDILGVAVNSVFRNTDCSALAPGLGSELGVYGNYLTLAPITTIIRGADNNFSVEIGSCSANFNPSRIAMYIDYNQNGSFDSGEEVYEQGAASTGPNTRSGVISVPLTANLGNAILRVIVAEGVAGDITPSTVFTEGEVEDHLITIINAPVLNDFYQSATLIVPGQYPLCSTSYSANLALASNSPESAGAGNDAWYRFNSPTNAVIITLTGLSDMGIELYDGSNTLIATEDAVSTNGNETLIIDDLIPGQDYWFAIGAIGAPSTSSVCVSSLRRSGCSNPSVFTTPCDKFKNSYTAANSYTAFFDDNGVAPFIATSTITGGATLHNLTSFAGLPPMTTTQIYQVRVDAVYNLQNAAGTPVIATVPGIFNCTRTIQPHPAVFLRPQDALPNIRPANATLGANQWICVQNYQWTFEQFDAVNGVSLSLPVTANGVNTSRLISLTPSLGLVPGGIYKVNIRPIFATGPGNLGPDRWLQLVGPSLMPLNLDEEGYAEMGEVPGILVYPNPLNDGPVSLLITNISEEKGMIRILDQTGRVVYRQELSGLNSRVNQLTIDTPLAGGMYLVEFTQNELVLKNTLVVTR